MPVVAAAAARHRTSGLAVRHVPLGRTGLQISRIGFGCGDRARLMVGSDTDDQVRVIGRALDAGITYFDTAAKYGAGRSERNLGHALRVHGADAVVGTKLDLPPDAGIPFTESVRAHAAASLERLGTDHVALYQLHNRIELGGAGAWAPAGSRRLTVGEVLGPGGVAEAMLRLKEDGLVSALGLTAFGGDPVAIAEVLDSGVFDTLNCSFHMLNPTAVVPPGQGWSALDYAGIAEAAARRGMTVLPIRALAGGRILTAGDGSARAASTDPDVASTAGVERILVAELERRGPGRALAAMTWSLAWPQLHCLIAGISEAAHVDDAVTAEQDRSTWTPDAAAAWCRTVYDAVAADGRGPIA